MKFKIFYSISDLEETDEVFEFNCESDDFNHAVDKIPANNPEIIYWEYFEDT
jgi:hypothetical protein